jgi:hypothetical protein
VVKPQVSSSSRCCFRRRSSAVGMPYVCVFGCAWWGRSGLVSTFRISRAGPQCGSVLTGWKGRRRIQWQMPWRNHSGSRAN